MSIITETKLHLEEEQVPLSISVSNLSTSPIVAIGVPNNVLFFHQNGDSVEYKIAKEDNPLAIDWHPTKNIAAIGWESGDLTLANLDKQTANEELNSHEGPIIRCLFNSGGQRMATIDNQSTIAIWKDMNCLSVFEKEGEITSLTNAELTVERKGKPSKSMSLFFVGNNQGIFNFQKEMFGI